MKEKEIAWLLEEKYHGEKTPKFFDDIKRLESGEPIAYVIGWKEFLGCHIDLSLHPLIPREETEWWVEQLILRIKRVKHQFGDQNIRILDLFSGSGAIGVALATKFSNAHITFGEKDAELLKQIHINVLRNNIDTSRVTILETDVFSNIQDTFDIIVANPPYIIEGSTRVSENVKVHEPALALYAKDNGLTYVKQLVAEAPRYLKTNGMLAIEFDDIQIEEVQKITSAYIQKEFLKDQFGLWRVIFTTYKKLP